MDPKVRKELGKSCFGKVKEEDNPSKAEEPMAA